MKPILKWVGGKQALLPQLHKRLPNMSRITTYIEPFVGAGSLFFSVCPYRFRKDTKSVLCDKNKALMNVYSQLKNDPDSVIYAHDNLCLDFLSCDEDGKKQFYYKVRSQVTSARTFEQAAIFLFLNKTCYNGLYRVNKKGEFNVPFGKYKRPSFVYSMTLAKAACCLSNSVLISGDFEQTVCFADSKTFVYIDPPYIPVCDSSKRAYYTSDGFSFDDHKRVIAMMVELDRRGSRFMLSMSDTPTSRLLYDRWHMEVVDAPRRVGCKVSSRVPVKELIVRNYV